MIRELREHATVGRASVSVGVLFVLLHASTVCAQASSLAEGAFNNVINAAQQALASAQGSLSVMGTQLWAALFLIAFTWKMGELVLEGGDFTNTLGGIMRTVFLGAFAYWLVTPFTLFGASGQLPLVWFLNSLGTSVAGAIMGNDGSLGGAAGSAFGTFAEFAGRATKVISTKMDDATLLEKIGVFFGYFVPFLYLTVAAIVMWVGGIAFFVMATIGWLMFIVGALLAPLFIPWLVLAPASWLFDGWLRFMIAATMYKIAGAAILAIGKPVILSVLDNMLKASSFTLDNIGQLTLTAMLAAAVALALAYIMLQLPNIAQGLVSGNATVAMGRLMSSLGRSGQQTAGLALLGAGKGTSGSVQATRNTPQIASAAKATIQAARNAVTTSSPGALGKRGAIALIKGTGAAIEGAGNKMSQAGRNLITGKPGP